MIYNNYHCFVWFENNMIKLSLLPKILFGICCFCVTHVFSFDRAIMDQSFSLIDSLANQSKVDTWFVARLSSLQYDYTHDKAVYDYLSSLRHYAADIVFALSLEPTDHYVWYNYFVRKGVVYYDNYIIHNADVASFDALDYDYAIDEHCAYFFNACVWPLWEANREFLGDNFSRYATTIFRKDIPLDANGLTFSLLGQHYAKDDQFVYFAGKQMSYDVDSFVLLGDGYVVDSGGVYYNNIPRNVDRDSFEYLGHHYVKANGHIFWYHQQQAYDHDSFVVLDPHYVADRNGVYFRNILLSNTSQDDFVILEYPFAKDTHYVYEQGKKVSRLDAKSFAIIDLSQWLVRDKYGIYKNRQWHEWTWRGRIGNLLQRIWSKLW